MKKTLTSRQQEILDFVKEFSVREQMPPTLSDIAGHFHIRCSSAAYHLDALRRKKRLTRTPNSRSIVLRDRTLPCLQKNCLRRVEVQPGEGLPAKLQIPAVYLSDEQISICPPDGFITICLGDDSMFDLGIRCGDTLLAVPVAYRKPAPGDIVLAETPDGRQIIRSYFPYSCRQFELTPANSDFKVERFPVSSKVIKGVVISLVRNF